jgi:stage V sporulation protein B
MIGAEGMSYYQAAYPIYILFLTISIAGFPVAVSRMVSEKIAFDDYHGAHRVFKVSFVVMGLLGLVLFSLLFFSADFISTHIKDLDGSVYAMKAIAPALFFVTIMSAFLGYFQGMRNMMPSAIIQVTEQLFRVITGLMLAWYLLRQGKEYAAAGATFGASAGSIAGFLVIIIIYAIAMRKDGVKDRISDTSCCAAAGGTQTFGQITRTLFAIAVPITIGAAVMPIINLIDLPIVTDRLAASGWDSEAVRVLYGQLNGLAQPVINMPQIITQSIAISLVPTIVIAFKKKDTEFLQYNVSLSIRTALILSLPCAAGIMVLAKPIMLLLYPLQRSDAIGAAPALFILAVGIIFLSLIQTLTGVLQGIGRQMIPVRNIAIGAACKVVLTFVLTGIPSINIMGAAFGTVAAYFVAGVLNVHAAQKYTGTIVDWSRTLLRPLLAVLVMSAVVFSAYHLLSLAFGNAIAAIAAIILGAVSYVIFIFVFRAITAEELALFPKGEFLVKIYRKVLTRTSKQGKM